MADEKPVIDPVEPVEEQGEPELLDDLNDDFIKEEEPVEETVPEEIDIDEALKNAQEAFQSAGIIGKSPEAEKIAKLEMEIEAIKQSGVQGTKKIDLPENATIDDLLSKIESMMEEKVSGYFNKTESQRQMAFQRQQEVMNEQNQAVEMKLKVLRDNKITTSREDEIELLKTCQDIRTDDVFKGVKVWDMKKKLRSYEESKQANSQKRVAAKLGTGKPISTVKPRLDVRKATFDDIASALAKRG
jgi:hypothetical protein